MKLNDASQCIWDIINRYWCSITKDYILKSNFMILNNVHVVDVDYGNMKNRHYSNNVTCLNMFIIYFFKTCFSSCGTLTICEDVLCILLIFCYYPTMIFKLNTNQNHLFCFAFIGIHFRCIKLLVTNCIANHNTH